MGDAGEDNPDVIMEDDFDLMLCAGIHGTHGTAQASAVNAIA